MATQANQDLNMKAKISAPGMWQFPTNPDLCCIYRVPDRIRKINPSAYTPQLLIIGPLHHSLKAQALKHLEDIDNSKFMGYLSMEQHKEIYLSAFTQRFDGEDINGGEEIIAAFRRVIEEEEDAIRGSYSESTAWIESEDFVEMILRDSVFILEFILRNSENYRRTQNTGDVLMQEYSLNTTVNRDLILLENQLPYFIFEKLFDPIIKILNLDKSFRTINIKYFGFLGKMNENSKFKHFTDLLRCVCVDSLKFKEGETEFNGVQIYKPIQYMYNAEKLHTAGIKFKVIKEVSLNVKFENGCLELPMFEVDDGTEMVLRNIMALEQCHYPYEAHVSSFIHFFDFLVDTDKDVDVLVEKGVVKNWIGEHGLVADVVNKLCLGANDHGSYYYDIAFKIDAHYKNPINKSHALLKRVYFKDMWTGTATIAAIFLLLMTLIQTITSIMQVLKKN